MNEVKQESSLEPLENTVKKEDDQLSNSNETEKEESQPVQSEKESQIAMEEERDGNKSDHTVTGEGPDNSTENPNLTTVSGSQETENPILGEDDARTIDPLSRYDRRTSHPLLQGHYINDGHQCIFSGLWGMSSSGVIRGMTSDFRYVMKLPESSPIDQPCNGSYNGYFWMRSAPVSRVTENNLVLSFTKHQDHYIVDGSGQNRMGPFSVAGLYYPSTHVMNCEKFYNPPPSQSRPKVSKPKPKPKTESLYMQGRTNSFTRSGSMSYLRETSLQPRGLSREMALCHKCLKKLMTHKWAAPFLHPVDVVALDIPDYYDVIKNPMDFSTISTQIETHVIRTKDEFASKVNLVFDNALLYNSKGSDVYSLPSPHNQLHHGQRTPVHFRQGNGADHWTDSCRGTRCPNHHVLHIFAS